MPLTAAGFGLYQLKGMVLHLRVLRREYHFDEVPGVSGEMNIARGQKTFGSLGADDELGDVL